MILRQLSKVSFDLAIDYRTQRSISGSSSVHANQRLSILITATNTLAFSAAITFQDSDITIRELIGSDHCNKQACFS